MKSDTCTHVITMLGDADISVRGTALRVISELVKHRRSPIIK